MNFRLQQIQNLDEVASFIAEYNRHAYHHVGYCGEAKDEILHTLLNDFSDLPIQESIIGAYDNNQLIGVLGLDIDQETQEAEVWGPFISGHNWHVIANEMWKRLLEGLSIPVKRFYGFYNHKHQNAAKFMQEHGFIQGNNHIVLCAEAASFKRETTITLQELSQEYEASFIGLHDQLFPSTYYNGLEILRRMNDERKVMVAIEDRLLLGYVYIEANPTFQEGSIEYIGVLPSERKRGIGSQLIQAALDQLFNVFLIKEIQLCVSDINEKALKLYRKAGFREKHVLISYHK